ncbi:unnamed protein product [Rotaria sp. Silwood1]|nr:unnamed protein product [Rotaria sp. Silwood1]CAF1146084.1 unnamed protein product [Rotaria sp. Silwood1]CAF3430023.1 unnamed protein product [Rotaria sp. Silwood1]CAF4669220.1 unnamed protein product [Rotaria sp. Silwood1]
MLTCDHILRNHWNTFRIVLSHTLDECFYLETKLDDTIHVIYQVLRGGDSLIRVTVTNSLGRLAYTQANTAFGWYDEENSKVAGVLAIHKDRILEASINTANEKKANETAIIEEFSTNTMQSLLTISKGLYRLTAYQTIERVQHAHDLYAVEANASYVQKWALCQIIAMIVCSIIQVFSIRRLFKSTISSKTSLSRKSNENFNPRTSPYFILAN